MTQAAVSATPQQGQLTLAVSLQHMQTWITEPFDEELCTEALVLSEQNFATVDPTIQDILSCDGRNLAGQIIRQWRGAFEVEILATSRWLGWALAIAWGAASSATPVAQSSAVFTETINASGGSRRLSFDGQDTEPIAYNANAAAIQAGVDAAIGAGKITVAGTGPYTYTATGPWANKEIRKPIELGLRLTGGAEPRQVIAVTTPGGPARSSYTITQSNDDQPPGITAVLGFVGGNAWRLQDLVVDTMRIALTAEGLFRIRLSFVWKGFYHKLASFDFPACSRPKNLEVQDSLAQFASTDFTATLNSYEYQFRNNIDGGSAHTNVSKYPQRLLRSFPLFNETTVAANEVAEAVYGLQMANAQNGTEGAWTLRAGSLSDGAVLSAPESLLMLGAGALDFGGPGNRARNPPRIRHFDSISASTRPVSATVVTDHADGYLTAA
jgi:hypothetical protein